jgi:hypothetical protein
MASSDMASTPFSKTNATRNRISVIMRDALVDQLLACKLRAPSTTGHRADGSS